MSARKVAAVYCTINSIAYHKDTPYSFMACCVGHAFLAHLILLAVYLGSSCFLLDSLRKHLIKDSGPLKPIGYGPCALTNHLNHINRILQVVENDRVPEHDVVVTNPPFSGDHITKILSFCARRSKPWFLLLPNYVYLKVHTMSRVLLRRLRGGDGAPRLLGSRLLSFNLVPR